MPGCSGRWLGQRSTRRPTTSCRHPEFTHRSRGRLEHREHGRSVVEHPTCRKLVRAEVPSCSVRGSPGGGPRSRVQIGPPITGPARSRSVPYRAPDGRVAIESRHPQIRRKFRPRRLPSQKVSSRLYERLVRFGDVVNLQGAYAVNALDASGRSDRSTLARFRPVAISIGR